MMPQQTMSRSQGMPHQNTSLSQPQQNMNKSQPVRVIYAKEIQQTPLSPSEREPTQSKEVNKVEEEAQNVPKMSESRQSEPEQPVQNQVDEAESTNFHERTNSEIEHSSSPAHRRAASKENHQQVRGRNMGPGLNLNLVQNPEQQMVEIQSLDLPSKQTSEETKSTPLSSRQLQSFRRASASRQKAMPTSASIPISKVENMNAAPLRIEQDLTPNKLTRLSEENGTSQFESAVSRLSQEDKLNAVPSRPSRDDSSSRNNANAVSSRPSQDDTSYRSKLETVSSRPSRAGAEGYGFIAQDEPRYEAIRGEDIPLSYVDIMKQKKRQNMQNTPDPSPKFEAPRQLETEDDWDKELFGDGKHSPVRTLKKFDTNSVSNYNSQYISQPNQSSAQLSDKLAGMNERKIVASIKEKTQSISTQKYVHNDWDDDL